MIELFFKLCIGHAVADFWAQSEGMRRAKGWTNDVRSQPGNIKVWTHAITAHALIHAGAVWVCTGSAWLAFAELIAHWCIDYGKCSGWFNTHVDQGAHIGCKAMWTVLA